MRSNSIKWMPSLLIMVSGVIPSTAEAASDVIPLYSFNQSPLVQIYGLPALGSARVLEQDKVDVSLQIQIANNSTDALNNVEYLVLDGETHRLTLVFRQGLVNGYEWGVELPYLSHSSGFMDNFIEDWHRTFGLRQGNRLSIPPNLINYHYSRNGTELVNVSRSTKGIGDIRLSSGMQLSHSLGERNVALRASLKIPTGESADLLGSGSTDLALWLSVAPGTKTADSWRGYGGGGILLLTDGDVLPDQQRNYVAFGNIGLSYRIIPSLTAYVQLDAHSAFYRNSDFRQLNATAFQGLLGVLWEFTPGKYAGFSISEDLTVDASPDFGVNLSVSFSF
ncbi:MAG: DUF3187 family protein [Gammaproteobacteria bacterium]|nr:DUF3187 family protein [Gammaproteobacteria bacterium]MDH3370861.1 DUF3187 family protein [Gammaproteobacteria bacterium]